VLTKSVGVFEMFIHGHLKALMFIIFGRKVKEENIIVFIRKSCKLRKM